MAPLIVGCMAEKAEGSSSGGWAPRDPPTADEVRLMALLVTGMTDEDGAARLGWTRRTLRRRLKSAMEKLGATSRLQAGYEVARVGWLEDREGPGGGSASSNPRGHFGHGTSAGGGVFPENADFNVVGFRE